jgi:hypothetical protein
MNATVTKREGRIYTIHSLDEIQVDTRVRALAALDEHEARALTTQIQRTSVRLWLLVTEAHDRKAHLALGYETWADYVKAELNMSESRSYQFLDTGHVMKALAAGGINVEDFQPPPTRVIARLKDRLTDVKRVAQQAQSKGEDVDKAMRTLAREPRVPSQRASAEGGGTKDEPEPEATETPPTRRGPRAQVSCPAGAGSGKVTQSVADRLLDLISKMKT